jgi:predicted phage terminase large subunit-like protein
MLESWHVLEPATPFIDNWHIDAIVEHLEACSRSEIRNLVINMPPRCQKSLLTGVFWFAWTWTWQPSSRWLCSSYAANLSTRDSVKARRLISSPWYQANFRRVFQLAGDQNLKTAFENDQTGSRLSTSVGGMGTGAGADILLVDDPHNVQQAESEAVREGTVEWWLETMSTRGNNPETTVKVVVMQRVHEKDLTGVILSRELGYEHLCLPMRYEAPDAGSPKKITSIGFEDPRHEEGELLWPTRFNESSVQELEKQLGSYGTAGQLQQRPAPRAGGMFKKEWFRVVPILPRTRLDAEGKEQAIGYTFVRYWDKAGTEGAGAYTAGVLMARADDGRIFVLNVVRGQWSAGSREAKIRATAESDKAQYGRVTIWVEQEPGSGGKESGEATLRTTLSGFSAHLDRVTGEKEIRAEPYATACEALNVWLVEGDWNDEYIAEHGRFPKGLKDQVDASSGAYNRLQSKREWRVG